MKYKYIVLKSSWGIAIELDMEEIVSSPILDTDIPVFEDVYLRIGASLNIKESIVTYWSVKALNDLRREISIEKKANNLCYYIKTLDFSFTDFQEEGIYGAIVGWFSKFYGLKLVLPTVEYDKDINRYIFRTSGKVLQ